MTRNSLTLDKFSHFLELAAMLGLELMASHDNLPVVKTCVWASHADGERMDRVE